MSTILQFFCYLKFKNTFFHQGYKYSFIFGVHWRRGFLDLIKVGEGKSDEK